MQQEPIRLTTMDHLPDAEVVETLGVVKGNTVKAKNVGSDFIQGLRNMTGGELNAYSDLLSEAREDALDRMVADAQHRGADAVVNVRFDTSTIADSSAEILAYGTAVRTR